MKFKISAAAAIASNFLKEQINSKLFYFFLVFSLLSAYVSSLLGLMAVDEERKILIDFGLAAGEISVFSFMLFMSSLAVNKEMETKTVYLILARPVPRTSYIFGKILGLTGLCALLMFAVSAVNILVLLIKGYPAGEGYFSAIFASFLKISIASLFALAASLITTSSFSGMIISLSAWIFGHFSSEVRFLAEKSIGIKKFFFLFFMNVMPNFQIFNFRDSASYQGLGYSFVYFLCYFFVLSLISSFIFSKKEF
ncbi:MAG: hypothetical protein GX447_07700 [Elusimicrobia bacterium]|nr:hypothetical protein [Elusimicrobiota bacterium]